MHPFEEYIEKAALNGGFHNDDIAAILLPLLEEVLSFHEVGKVGPLEGLNHILITNEKLDIDENYVLNPRRNSEALYSINATDKSAFEITEQKIQVEYISEGSIGTQRAAVIETDLEKQITKPVYLIGYNSYEHKIGLHDELTDIYSMGMLLASVALGLNFNNSEHLKEFIEKRDSLLYLNNKLHPAIGNLIVEMTELYRHKRAQDLYEIISRLQNFRDYNPEKVYDLSVVAGFQKQDNTTKPKWILNKLKSRLFDMSRRNKLLYFKPNLKFVNLTVASVPNVVNINNISPDSILVWNDDIAAKIVSQKDIALSKYLRFEDNTYLPGYLDKLKQEHERDKKEYGFSQLKLVGCFLNWYHFKDDANERLQTPLILIPVNITKKKGLKDQYLINATDTEAEVNPILVHILKEQYGIKLPEKIDLSESSVNVLYAEIVKQIEDNKSGIKLELIDKPRIKIIQTLAKQVLNQYNRRIQNRGRQLGHYRNFDYSYSSDNYQPLGLQIFKNKIQPQPSFLEWLINDDLVISNEPAYLVDNDTKERELLSLTDDSNNHFRWEFDMCNVVLGNFNYKKMSLVSDYNAIVDENLNSKVFDDIFSAEPKKFFSGTTTIPLANQYPVVVADPTQSAAVEFSNHTESYIIQGPPGTGKSQTITNLIAHYAAAGKKVLFVCEKRAALDVVYYRLKQQNLHDLCCLVHDSKEDKKQLIQELKTTYEKYSKQSSNLVATIEERDAVVSKLSTKIELLHRFEKTFSERNTGLGISLRKLVERLVELKDKHSNESHNDMATPNYAEWVNYGKLVEKLNQTISPDESQPWAAHIGASLNKELFKHDEPINNIKELTAELTKYYAEIKQVTGTDAVPFEVKESFSHLAEFTQTATLLNPLAQTGNIALLNKESAHHIDFKKALAEYKQLVALYTEQTGVNENWLAKLNANELPAAKEIATKWEGKLFSFINGQYRRLKKTLQASYNFSKHSIKPSFKSLLLELEKEYELAKKIKLHEAQTSDTYNISDIITTDDLVKKADVNPPKHLAHYMSIAPNRQAELVSAYSKLNETVTKAANLSAKIFASAASAGQLAMLNNSLEEITKKSNELLTLTSVLKELTQASDVFLDILNNKKLKTDEFEALVAHKNILKIYDENKSLENINSDVLATTVEEIKALYKDWLKLNAQFILAQQHDKFSRLLQVGDAATANLKPEGRELKNQVLQGRKVLEHEFTKQMKFKPIRELAAGATGLIIKNLRPVWLMSPLSVSDTLPIDSSFFDVVIFDEASQITLEEGIPTIFRASQTIVVGDEMQMPPTNFFGSAVHDPDELFEEDVEIAVNLDADSLLTQSARKLPSVMLGWHYRSRYESLISYSNNAFYNAGLLTIPDSTAVNQIKNEIIISDSDIPVNTSYLHDRSISYHFLENGVYQSRTNTSEAKYIANMVLTLIKNEAKESIGIVAFSQEQQMEIENAIDNLSREWNMVTKLDEAYERTEEDQFVGLFIKNLENVQGDERDIIIMSVCYGYDSNKKMIMNFGPINKKGGERRLNVIFSRAKKHMAIVASIKYTDIKNEYNEGANYLRRFLQYAEYVSKGAHNDAGALLKSFIVDKQAVSAHPKNSVVDDIATWLESKGFITTKYLGQSYFKCHIGVKAKADNTKYDLGILIDTASYSDFNVVEQYYLQPEIMKAFGWNVLSILTKDWLYNRSLIEDKILKALNKHII